MSPKKIAEKMSLFPAYEGTGAEKSEPLADGLKQTPVWLKNTSFKRFEQQARSKSTSRSASRSSRSGLSWKLVIFNFEVENLGVTGWT